MKQVKGKKDVTNRISRDLTDRNFISKEKLKELVQF